VDIQKEWQALDREFLQHLEGSKQRLITGRAKSRVAREMDKMNQSGDLRSRFYRVCDKLQTESLRKSSEMRKANWAI